MERRRSHIFGQKEPANLAVNYVQRAEVKRWEQILTLITLFLSTGALLSVLLEGPATLNRTMSAAPERSVATEIVWVGLYAVFIVLSFVRRQRLLVTLIRERIVCWLVGLAALSTVWSDLPSITLWNSARLLATTFFGIYLAKTYSLRDILRMVAWASALSAVLSIIFALALPQYGLDVDSRQLAWRGIFEQKNSLGNNMALGALAWLIFALGAGRPRWLGVLFFTVCSLLVMLSGSATAIVLECALLVTIVAFNAKLHSSISIPASLCLIVLGTLAVAEVNHPMDLLLGLLNRDSNLTGRREIWSMVLEAITKRPWLGYGYAAFWRGSDGPSADVVINGWIPSSAHNGFLDLALDFGVIGPVLFAFALSGPILYSIRLAQRRNSPVELFPLIFLLFILLSNLTESRNVTPNTVIWVLFVTLCVRFSFAKSQFRNLHARDQSGIMESTARGSYQIYRERFARERI